ncbi:unnamed protein product [Effrenium voratum]|uniref:Uncharacterized protein n=1 Tax=Effrenium voratum TaxID=2562239 RepID=A0AA36IL06_9DINO|nr:unnamed protein product [Effrenium voratum]
MEELEEAVKDARAAGLKEASELVQANEVLRKHQHRVAVRRAEVAHQKARQRLALAWRSLTTPCAPHARGAACGEAVTQSASAAPLLRSSGRPQEAQRLEEAKDDLARSWSKLAEQSLKEAAYMCDLQQMRSAVKECGVLREIASAPGRSKRSGCRTRSWSRRCWRSLPRNQVRSWPCGRSSSSR